VGTKVELCGSKLSFPTWNAALGGRVEENNEDSKGNEVGSALDAAGSVDEVEDNVGYSGSELGVELTAGQWARSVVISCSISKNINSFKGFC
jgi:hypothetical protein